MSETKELLRRGGEGFAPREDIMDSLIRRRDRKRRNQRIAAGVVGIAVFVAAVWIVTNVSSLDRSEKAVVPAATGPVQTGPAETGPAETGPAETGPAETGPAETGPAETGPAETGPAETGPTVAPDNSFRIPPAGTAVSTPVEGELIAEAYVGVAGQIRVYADGRVLSAEHNGGIIVERRLSPEGVELVRQALGERVHLGYGPGAVRLESLLGYPGLYSGDIRQSAWEDREGKPYVPARYEACFRRTDSPSEVEALLDLLPASAQALLRGSDPAARNPRCLVVTPEEARSLEEILSEALSSRGDLSLGWDVGVWSLRGGNDAQFIRLSPLFPEGRRFFWVPF